MMAIKRPTESAEGLFKSAAREALLSRADMERHGSLEGGARDFKQSADIFQAMAIENLANGLAQLSIGLRATYALLDQMNSQMQFDRMSRPRAS